MTQKSTGSCLDVFCLFFFVFFLPARLKKDLSDEEPMQTDMAESPYVPGPDENPLYTAEPLTLDDLRLLSDLFYLPYEHGPTSRSMLQELDWLKNHSLSAPADTDQVALCRVFSCMRPVFCLVCT